MIFGLTGLRRVLPNSCLPEKEESWPQPAIFECLRFFWTAIAKNRLRLNWYALWTVTAWR